MQLQTMDHIMGDASSSQFSAVRPPLGHSTGTTFNNPHKEYEN
jgi:hypothetical protein